MRRRNPGGCGLMGHPLSLREESVMSLKFAPATRGLVFAAAIGAAALTQQAQGAFHLWQLNEVYSNSSGSLQFIELQDVFGGQQFVANLQVQVSNVGNTQTHTF